jgi:hypothetical protein
MESHFLGKNVPYIIYILEAYNENTQTVNIVKYDSEYEDFLKTFEGRTRFGTTKDGEALWVNAVEGLMDRYLRSKQTIYTLQSWLKNYIPMRDDEEIEMLW